MQKLTSDNVLIVGEHILTLDEPHKLASYCDHYYQGVMKFSHICTL